MPERVPIEHSTLVAILARRKAEAAESDNVFQNSYLEVSDLLRETARFFRMPHERVTSHCMRRGGATWRFSRFKSYDLTATFGR